MVVKEGLRTMAQLVPLVWEAACGPRLGNCQLPVVCEAASLQGLEVPTVYVVRLRTKACPMPMMC